LVRPPLRELRQILDDAASIRVKDMRSVAMDEHPVLVELVERIAADVRALLDDLYASARACQSLGYGRACESRADNDIVELHVASGAFAAIPTIRFSRNPPTA